MKKSQNPISDIATEIFNVIWFIFIIMFLIIITHITTSEEAKIYDGYCYDLRGSKILNLQCEKTIRCNSWIPILNSDECEVDYVK